jgi:general secretion pathway protein C
MLTFSLQRFPGRHGLPLLTVAVWGLAAASMAYWALQWPKPEANAATSVSVAPNRGADLHAPMAKALGQAASSAANDAPQTSSTYKLMGVIASASGQGSALIATDGQPPKAYRVGQTVQDGWTLVSLTARQARLKSSSAEVLLELPPADKR